jgi:hypothetical protein
MLQEVPMRSLDLPADGDPDDDSPQDVATEVLEQRVCELAAHLASGMCSFLLMVGELDRRRSWANWEAVSCAHWLSWRCGVGLAAAREQVRVARALAGLPLIRTEFAAGRLSYSKVRAVTRIATPELEQELVDLALASTAAQTERWVRGYRRSERDDPRDDHLDDTAPASPYRLCQPYRPEHRPAGRRAFAAFPGHARSARGESGHDRSRQGRPEHDRSGPRRRDRTHAGVHRGARLARGRPPAPP